jgi:hypothetical protein
MKFASFGQGLNAFGEKKKILRKYCRIGSAKEAFSMAEGLN